MTLENVRKLYEHYVAVGMTREAEQMKRCMELRGEKVSTPQEKKPVTPKKK